MEPMTSTSEILDIIQRFKDDDIAMAQGNECDIKIEYALDCKYLFIFFDREGSVDVFPKSSSMTKDYGGIITCGEKSKICAMAISTQYLIHSFLDSLKSKNADDTIKFMYDEECDAFILKLHAYNDPQKYRGTVFPLPCDYVADIGLDINQDGKIMAIEIMDVGNNVQISHQN